MAPALTRLIGTTRGRVTLLVGTVSVWLVTSVINHVAFHAYSSFGDCLWWGARGRPRRRPGARRAGSRRRRQARRRAARRPAPERLIWHSSEESAKRLACAAMRLLY
jgi:hypothetical protein